MAPKVTDSYKTVRQTEILDAAERVFYRQGYLKTTMQDVIDESGISRGGIYLYFENKESLFKAVLERSDTSVLQELENLGQIRPCWKAIESFFVTTDDSISTDDLTEIGRILSVVEFTLSRWSDSDKMVFQHQRYDKTIDAFAHLLDIGVRIGEFKPLFPIRTIAQMIIAVSDGWSVGALGVGFDTIDVQGQTNAMLGFLRYALQVKEN